MPVTRFKIDESCLLVVDLQEKLLPHMHEESRLLIQASKLIRGAAALGVPVIATEQYPKGLGPTTEPIVAALSEAGDIPREPKTAFSAFIEPVRDWLAERSRPSVVVCGIESHVCVTQTVLDLMNRGYLVGLVTDAMSSRRESDHLVAISRLVSSGAIPLSVEMILFEWAGRADSDAFKAILPIIK
ncbi:MAG: hydrolase [Planctomycetota bacterium]|jgi:nicotinamidase-related amidase